MEADELFPVADTLQLFRFVEIEGPQIRLTAAGKQYAVAEVDARKQLFNRHLLSYVPLAGHIRRILDERPNHHAPARRFRDELEDYMSEDYADQTLKAVIGWGRYGETFAYDEGADRFSLEDPA
jgi:NitT/TauT family transport system ATP-binding protein